MRRLFFAAAVLATWTPLHAQRADSAAFIIRIGNDTSVIERYIRTADKLIVEAVTRSPTTASHQLVLDIAPNGNVQRGVYTSRRLNATTPPVERVITVPPGLIPVTGPFYAPYELVIQQAARSSAAKNEIRMLTGTDTVVIPVERIGRDSVTLTNQFGEPMRAHVDAVGRLLHLHTPAFTTVERLQWMDLDAFTREFAARDATGKGMGPLSPRYAARTRVGGANVWIDYSRPAMRGRPIWGGLVPYGNVWRTGANDAAHISFDKTVQLGDLTLAPGTYTLFLLPTANDWTLIVNRQTGISGLARDPKQDVGSVKLELQTLQRPAELFTIDVTQADDRGVLGISWDRTRGTVPFTVK